MISESGKAAYIAEAAPDEVLTELECTEAGERVNDKTDGQRGGPRRVVYLQLLYSRRNMFGVIEAHKKHSIRHHGVEVDAQLAQAVERSEIPMDGEDLKVRA